MSIAVPTGVNFLSLSAFTTMTGAAHTAIIAWFQVDDANCLNASGTFNNRPFGSIGGAGQSTIALNQVVAVSPGATHTVTRPPARSAPPGCIQSWS